MPRPAATSTLPLVLQEQLPRGVWEAPFRALDGHSVILWAITSKGHILDWEKVRTFQEYAGVYHRLTTRLDAADPVPSLHLLR